MPMAAIEVTRHQRDRPLAASMTGVGRFTQLLNTTSAMKATTNQGSSGGRVVPGSYRGNPSHRLLSERGLVQVDEWVRERLVEELTQLG